MPNNFGISALQKIQIGVETAAGLASDPTTTVFVGNPGMLKDNLKLVFPDEKVGILTKTTRSYIPVTGGEITLSGETNFEQLPYILNSGLYRVAKTTDTNPGTGNIRTWNMQCVSSDPVNTTDLDTLSIQGGDDVEVEQAHFGFIDSFTLAGSQGNALTCSAHVITRAISTDTGFDSVSIPTVETILFSASYLYIDPSTDAPGTTAKSETMLDVNLVVTTGWKTIAAKDNRTDFSNIKNTGGSAKLDITFEHNASSIAEKTAWRAQTERVLRLKFVGSALTAAGAYTYKTFIVDLYGKWESFEALGDQDGDTICKGTFDAKYATGPGKMGTFVIVNNLASLP